MMARFKTKAGINKSKKDISVSNMKLPGFYKTRYLAIDQSLASTGVIAADYRLNVKRALTLPTYSNQLPEARINQIGSLLDGVLKMEGPNLKFAVLERPAFNASGLKDVLSGCYWECRRRIWLYNPELEIFTVSVNSWKAYAVGHGWASKAKVKSEIEKRYNKKFHSQDCYDAYGLLLYAVAKYKGKI